MRWILPPCALQDVFRAVLFADLDFCGPPWDEISPQAKDLVVGLLSHPAPSCPSFLLRSLACSSLAVGLGR